MESYEKGRRDERVGTKMIDLENYLVKRISERCKTLRFQWGKFLIGQQEVE